MNLQKIFSFFALLVLSFVALILLANFIDLDSLGVFAPLLLQFLVFWIPGLIILIMQRGVYKGSMGTYGLNRKYMQRKWYWMAVAFPYVALLGTAGIIFIFGNLLKLPEFGQIFLGPEQENYLVVIEQLKGNSFYMAIDSIWQVQASMPPDVQRLFMMMLILGGAMGATIFMVFMLGEEIAWRGFMVVETQKMGFLGSNLLVGGLWGAWMLLLSQLSGADFELWESLALLGFCVSISFPMAYMNFKANSVLASAAFRAVFSFVSVALMCVMIGGTDRVGSMTGLAGMWFFLIVTFLILKLDPQFVKDYPSLKFHRALSPDVDSNTFSEPEASQEEEGPLPDADN